LPFFVLITFLYFSSLGRLALDGYFLASLDDSSGGFFSFVFFCLFLLFLCFNFFFLCLFCSNNLYFPSLDPSLALGSHSTVILFFRSWLSSFGDSSGGFFYFYFFSLKLSSEFFLCFFLFFLEYCHLCGGTF
jgi:hypothetical protein